MLKINFSVWLVSALILTACAGDNGERVPIRKSGSAKGSSKTKMSGITIKSKDGKKSCLNLPEVIKKITALNQNNFRTYRSDLRILESNSIDLQNLKSHPSLENQKQFLQSVLKENSESFYIVDYAKNIVKDVPSTLAPFSVSKQTNCESITGKFLEDTTDRNFYIVQDNATDFFLQLQSEDKKENYSFQLANQDQLNFTYLLVTSLEITEGANKTKKDFLARAVHTYEWGYSSDKGLSLSYPLVNSFKEVLTKIVKEDGKADKKTIEMPTEVLNSLNTTTASDTSRIRLSSEDLIRMRQEALKTLN